MKLLQKTHIKSYLAKMSVAVLTLGVTVALGTAVTMAWGPENRPTYTIKSPAPHITFNSITDNPDQGDERNFVTVRRVDEANNQWRDVVNVDGDAEYIVRMYVHNNAAANLNLVAENVRAKASIPTTVGNSVTLQGQLSANKASPKEIWDQVVFKSKSRKFNIAYIAGTARYYTNANPSNGFQLSDDVIKPTGALLGYDSLNGRIPGCFQYSGILTFRVKTQVQKKANFEVNKQVRKAGDKEWQRHITVKPGEKIEYMISYRNTGEVDQNDVIAKDQLPKSISYTQGTTLLKNGANPNGDGLHLESDKLTTNGVNIGNYAPGAAAYVKFSAEVAKEETLACGLNRLVNRVQITTQHGTKENTATVDVERKCQHPIEVCNKEDNSLIKIEEKEFDSNKHSKNTAECAKEIKVCDKTNKTIITIKEDKFDSNKHSKNEADCAAAPGELPHTGPTLMIGVMIALMAAGIGAAYFFRNQKEKKVQLEATFGKHIALPKTKLLEAHIKKTPKDK